MGTGKREQRGKIHVTVVSDSNIKRTDIKSCWKKS